MPDLDEPPELRLPPRLRARLVVRPRRSLTGCTTFAGSSPAEDPGRRGDAVVVPPPNAGAMCTIPVLRSSVSESRRRDRHACRLAVGRREDRSSIASLAALQLVSPNRSTIAACSPITAPTRSAAIKQSSSSSNTSPLVLRRRDPRRRHCPSSATASSVQREALTSLSAPRSPATAKLQVEARADHVGVALLDLVRRERPSHSRGQYGLTLWALVRRPRRPIFDSAHQTDSMYARRACGHASSRSIQNPIRSVSRSTPPCTRTHRFATSAR